MAWVTRSYGSAVLAWVPLAGYVALLSLITLATTFVMPETRGRDLDDLRDAGQEVGV
jgi:MHS family metabolite:H+ symporter-like MFS transporter